VPETTHAGAAALDPQGLAVQAHPTGALPESPPPPPHASSEPDGIQGKLLSAVEYLGTMKAQRAANLAYAAELANTSPQIERGFGDDERSEEEEILFERESPDHPASDRPSFALPRGRTSPSIGRVGDGINEDKPDQDHRQMADLQAQMAVMAAMLIPSVKTLAQSLELKQANQFFEMQRFQTSVSDAIC